MMYRHFTISVHLLGALLGLVGCASQGSVRAVQEEMVSLRAETMSLKAETASLVGEAASLRREVAEIRQAQDQAEEQSRLNRAKLALDLKAIGDRMTTAIMEQQVLGERVKTLEGRIIKIEATLSEMREPLAELSTQVARLTPLAPPEAEKEKPPQPSAGEDSLYQSAMAYYRRGELGQAILEFDEFVTKSPSHPFAMMAQYWIGEAYYSQRDYGQALVEFQKVVDLYPGGGKVPDALLKIGLSHRALRNSARAVEVWQRLIRDYPTSDAAKQARIALRSRAPAAPPRQGR